MMNVFLYNNVFSVENLTPRQKIKLIYLVDVCPCRGRCRRCVQDTFIATKNFWNDILYIKYIYESCTLYCMYCTLLY
jgi:hypothetical protein